MSWTIFQSETRKVATDRRTGIPTLNFLMINQNEILFQDGLQLL